MALPKMAQTKLLHGEILFYQYYVKMGTGGSFRKLAQWYEKNYGVNPNTQVAYTHEAIVQAMWRWGLENLKEAERIYMMYLVQFETDETNFPARDVLWKDNIQKRTKSCYKVGTKKYREFYRDHPEYV